MWKVIYEETLIYSAENNTLNALIYAVKSISSHWT